MAAGDAGEKFGLNFVVGLRRAGLSARAIRSPMEKTPKYRLRAQARGRLEAIDPATVQPLAIPLLDESDLHEKVWTQMTEQEFAAWHMADRVYIATDVASLEQRELYWRWRHLYPPLDRDVLDPAVDLEVVRMIWSSPGRKTIVARLRDFADRSLVANEMAIAFERRVVARLQGDAELVEARWSQVELEGLFNEVVGLPTDTPHPHLQLEGLDSYILRLHAEHLRRH